MFVFVFVCVSLDMVYCLRVNNELCGFIKASFLMNCSHLIGIYIINKINFVSLYNG